jgi:hypothetical protein
LFLLCQFEKLKEIFAGENCHLFKTIWILSFLTHNPPEERSRIFNGEGHEQIFQQAGANPGFFKVGGGRENGALFSFNLVDAVGRWYTF